ncbi:subtilisin-like protease [Colletotrichum kahawae]|uniref:Subtilisin-like protease n=1 Tax=Colletotrichum kahawae TaxID=34407 RepID=A0AAE0D596_COLKA|nr:subtilisin-like protease [Colletotrichum kahawae]
MWQLALLSHVIPAFVALGKDFIDRDNKDEDLLRDASDCYSDIIHIGVARPLGTGDRSAQETAELSLSQHPSSGLKEISNKIYRILERNWQCNCNTARQSEPREARLSLIRHHILGLKLTSNSVEAQIQRHKANYEVLLPVCKNRMEWKVTNVAVSKDGYDRGNAAHDRQCVSNDICQWLQKSKGFPVDFLVENDGLWHLRPRRSPNADHYTAMESLQQLLEDGMSMSRVSNYSDKEKLTLCYILANSMLLLYPGSWLRTAWNSNKVYFIRRAGVSALKPVTLTFPYLSVEMQDMQDATSSSRQHTHMQAHSHPNILALGIIFLEIATGSVFPRNSQTTADLSWEQCNEDFLEAWKQMENLETERKYIPSALRKVIRACIDLKPPPNIPSSSLTEEGPIRQYILSCIILPLASELVDGYNIRLEELHTSLEKELNGFGKVEDSTTKTPLKQTPESCRHSLATVPEDGDEREITVNEEATRRTREWFGYHEDALFRAKQLRDVKTSNERRIKIAILDSGIELTSEHREKYDFEPRIQYKSWVDGHAEWRDDVGHGTHLAILLRKVAPNAEIHMARVFKSRPTGDKSARIIAEALRYAVNVWEVDIVVMSFGFFVNNDVLYQEIQDAARKGVLMFAAASNGGKNRPDGIAWPAREENVICVHSADGYGNRSTFTPSPMDNMRIMVLGECINSAWPRKLRSPDDHRQMSGTSCAAPIAAGIAAVVLDCARGFLSGQEWRSLCRVRSMRRMFEAMKDSGTSDGYWWIKHWTLFSEDRKDRWIQEEIRSYIR